jgi:hypothetical protein
VSKRSKRLMTSSNLGGLPDSGGASVVSERRQHPVDESRELRLMVCASLGEGLLELGPRCGRS